MAKQDLDMKPQAGSIDLSKAAVLVIDMQRDFLEPGGFGDKLGNDVSKLQKAVGPCQQVLEAAREAGLLIVHTREGHRPDLTDLHPHKASHIHHHHPNNNNSPAVLIGAPGPNGRVLIRGEPGHDIIPELYPLPGEPVVDKPGKGSFYGTDLEVILVAQGIRHLFVCGVTTEVCVHTTVREANDRGYHCIVVEDACASFFDDFHDAAIRMIVAQDGIFGSTTDSTKLCNALRANGQC